MNTIEFEKFGATFSDCGKHRIFLVRQWDDSKPMLMVIGLNPSTANGVTDDPTIKKVRNIAKFNGYGGFYMVNLFTFISTDPKKLNIKEGNLPDADIILKGIAKECSTVVCAWGNFDVFGRDKEVRALFEETYCLHINKNGSPKHPLYCKNESDLIYYFN